MSGLSSILMLVLVAAFLFIQLEANSIQSLENVENSEVQRSARTFGWGWKWGWPWGWPYWYRPWYVRTTPISTSTSDTTTSSNVTDTAESTTVPTNGTTPTNDTTPTIATTSPPTIGRRDLNLVVEELQRRSDDMPPIKNCSHHPGHHTKRTATDDVTVTAGA